MPYLPLQSQPFCLHVQRQHFLQKTYAHPCPAGCVHRVHGGNLICKVAHVLIMNIELSTTLLYGRMYGNATRRRSMEPCKRQAHNCHHGLRRKHAQISFMIGYLLIVSQHEDFKVNLRSIYISMGSSSRNVVKVF